MSSIATAPSLAIARLLDGQAITYGEEEQGTCVLALGGNLWRGPIRDDDNFPDECVFCHVTSAQAPLTYKGGDNKIRTTCTVSVFVRVESNRYEDGEDLARALLRYLHNNPPTGYIECEALDGEPLFQGVGKNERPVFQIQLKTIRTETF